MVNISFIFCENCGGKIKKIVGRFILVEYYTNERGGSSNKTIFSKAICKTCLKNLFVSETDKYNQLLSEINSNFKNIIKQLKKR